MPDRQTHNRFDKYLIEREYLFEEYDYNAVHNRIDKGVKWYGGAHRDEDYYHSEEGLRDWLRGKENQGMKQDKLTAFLRCGMAHFALDKADERWYDKDPSNYDNFPWEKIFEGALKSVTVKGWDRKYYKSA